ncbi:hypothetical protein AAMO2058_001452100 [Amorphochlora amoebiformis]
MKSIIHRYYLQSRNPSTVAETSQKGRRDDNVTIIPMESIPPEERRPEGNSPAGLNGKKSEMKVALLSDSDGSYSYNSNGHRDRRGSDLEAELARASSSGEIEDLTTRRDLITFFLLGLINNSSFVIFAASAKEIAASSVGLVYLCASIPSFGIRISAPYWFDRVPYKKRMTAATVLMILSFTGVAVAPFQWLQLLGVMFTSAQQGLGEATLLSLCSRYGNRSLTAWSSGTGLAGLFGYAWIIVFKTWMGLPFRLVLLLANVLAAGYVFTFWSMRPPPQIEGNTSLAVSPNEEKPMQPVPASEEVKGDYADTSIVNNEVSDVVRLNLTFEERLKFSLSLWRITVPLIIVYMAEYAAQAGAWAAIGFPTHDATAREKFYEYANWCYQGGVFVSRSSGEIFKPGVDILWSMSIFQCVVLIFFVLDAQHKFWYDYSLLSMAFCTGLLGGAVYVNAFRLIAAGVPPRLKEIAMTAGAVSSDFGTNLGEALGIGLQTYLYRVNSISE